MKIKFLVTVIICVLTVTRARAQLTISAGWNNNYSKSRIAESHDPAKLIKSKFTGNSGQSFGISYLLNEKFLFALRTELYSFTSTASSTLTNRETVYYDIGPYRTISLDFGYNVLSNTKNNFNLILGGGLGYYCNYCTKNEPKYRLNNYTNKSEYPSAVSQVYMNGWEAQYNPKEVLLFNSFVEFGYTLKKYLYMGLSFRGSMGSTWNSRVKVRFENNGVYEGYDQYEDSYAILENRSLNLSVAFKLGLTIPIKGLFSGKEE